MNKFSKLPPVDKKLRAKKFTVQQSFTKKDQQPTEHFSPAAIAKPIELEKELIHVPSYLPAGPVKESTVGKKSSPGKRYYQAKKYNKALQDLNKNSNSAQSLQFLTK
jgi:hypothetical protein